MNTLVKHPFSTVLWNRIFRYILPGIQRNMLWVIGFIFLCTCNKANQNVYDDVDVSDVMSRELPRNPQELKILGIGNSYTEDAMLLLPNLLDSAHIYNVTLGMLTLGGAALDTHLANYLRDSHVYTFEVTKENHWEPVSTSYTISDAINYSDWDIIILQQVSKWSGQIKTYQPYLDQLIRRLSDHCSNGNVVLGWHMTWAYASNYTNGDFKSYGYNQGNMYSQIVESTQAMQAKTGIQVIIPSGTAIQNLRNTPLNDSMDLTRDGTHITLGVGRYTLACTWFQTLIPPTLGVDLAGNRCREQIGIPVTDNNYTICQQAAIQACNNKFEVSQQ